MAEQVQQNAPAGRGRGGGAAGRGRGGGGNTAVPGATMLLNPERAPALISKWQKLLGKDLEEIRVTYTAEGVSVDLYGKEGTPYHKLASDGETTTSLSIAEYREEKGKVESPSGEDAKFAFRNKFEVRLNLEFPTGLDLGDGSETALRNAVQALPFQQRRVMLMSNKQFKTAYPNGFAGAAEAAA